MDKDLESETTPENRPFYRKKGVMTLIGLTTFGALFACIVFCFQSCGYVYTDNAMVDGQKISISSECAGRIMKMTATEGIAVKKDDLLVELDPSEVDAEEAKAEAALRSDEANIKLAEINFGKAGHDLKRAGDLYNSGVISLAQYEQSEKNFSDMKIQKKMADLQALSARAQLKIAEAQARFRRIDSPDDGVVAKKWVNEGDVVQPGQVLYTIYNLGKVSVLANMEETAINKVHKGQKALVTIDAYPGQEFKGEVASIFPCTASELVPAQTSNGTGDFTKLTQYVSLRVQLDGISSNSISSRFPILPGLSVEVKVQEN